MRIMVPGMSDECNEVEIYFRTYNQRVVKCILIECVDGIDDEFVGVAKCDPQDEFDFKVGRKLALERALDKRLKKRLNYLFDQIAGENCFDVQLRRIAHNKLRRRG